MINALYIKGDRTTDLYIPFNKSNLNGSGFGVVSIRDGEVKRWGHEDHFPESLMERCSPIELTASEAEKLMDPDSNWYETREFLRNLPD